MTTFQRKHKMLELSYEISLFSYNDVLIILSFSYYLIAIRVNKKILELTNDIAKFTKDGAQKIEKKLSLFQEEVIAEAERLDNESNEGSSTKSNQSKNWDYEEPQKKIDHLRSKVADLSRKLETRK